MNIQEISKLQREVTVTLSSDELIQICNALYHQYEEEKKKESFVQLYSGMIIARDLCQYGHLDNFSLHSVVKCRNEIGNGIGGVLSDDDIETFNSYLKGGDIEIAFKNSDWNEIYQKIVGENGKK